MVLLDRVGAFGATQLLTQWPFKKLVAGLRLRHSREHVAFLRLRTFVSSGFCRVWGLGATSWTLAATFKTLLTLRCISLKPLDSKHPNLDLYLHYLAPQWPATTGHPWPRASIRERISGLRLGPMCIHLRRLEKTSARAHQDR